MGVPEGGELGHEDDDGQAVDKADHDGMRDQADEAPQFEHPEEDLDPSRHHDDGKEVLQAEAGAEGITVLHCLARDHRDSSSRSGDHPGTTSESCRDKAHEDSCPEADQRVDSGGESKGDGFWHEGQSYGEAGKGIVFVAAIGSAENFKYHRS